MKLRVISLIVFCAVIGMFLATPGMVPWRILLAGALGIGLVAGAAAAVNCLIEQKIDAVMARTRGRPLPRGEVNSEGTLVFSCAIGAVGLLLLYVLVNPFTMWLTLATFVGYAIIYTVFLKPNTSQNIVIGGASGAMPPVLGWAAVTGEAPGEAWLLFLIIFVWTPPHFWSLALYRTKEYAAAGLPMLPVTHGAEYTRRHVFFYTVGLTIITMVPFAIGMSGWFYLISAAILDAIFLGYAWLVWRDYSDEIARKSFRWSIIYLALLFTALLIDHYLPM
jgi:protoheme IX farnesyltransferase